MRPGQLTPENSLNIQICRCPMVSFNEAGAINPGKLYLETEELGSYEELQ